MVFCRHTCRCRHQRRRFAAANLKERTCTRECPAILVDVSLPGQRVVALLEEVAKVRGYPDVLVVDNGPELRGRDLDRWAHEHGVRLFFIDPGKPMQNGSIESFNGRFREECLDQSWFTSLAEAPRHRGLAASTTTAPAAHEPADAHTAAFAAARDRVRPSVRPG
jgi:transposase InsO family protein